MAMFADLDAEQVVNLVLEHERGDEVVGDAGDGHALLHALDGEHFKYAVFHERVLHVDAGLGVDGKHLHETVAFGLQPRRKLRQAFDGDLLDSLQEVPCCLTPPFAVRSLRRASLRGCRPPRRRHR